MRPAAIAYIYVVAFAAIALVAASSPSSLFLVRDYKFGDAMVFGGIALFFQYVAVRQLNAGKSTGAYSSLMYLPLFGCIILFPPIVVIAAAAGVQAISELVMMKPRLLWRAVLNTSVVTLFFGSAAWTYGSIETALPVDWDIHYLAFAASVLVAFIVNHATINGFVTIRQNSGLKQAVENFRGSLPSLVPESVTSTTAIIAVMLYNEFGYGGVVLLLFLLYIVYRSAENQAALQRANNDLLTALVKTIETRDPYTSGHSVRVSALAAQLSKDLRLSRSVAKNVETAALLHDIGKIDAEFAPLISKPYDLTTDERSLIQTHATRGADLLKTWSTVSTEVVRAVRHHHERYDGTGYPDHLSGEDIPLAARIIMLCDSVDAMLSDRPYRNALPVHVVEDELLRHSGRQFDPEIVKVVLKEGTLRKAEAMASASNEVASK
jgi:putative nucleotidyltransferase with HDIG domain